MTQRDEVYETIRVREGRIPFLAEHHARLGAGAAELGIRVAPGLDENSPGRGFDKIVWNDSGRPSVRPR